MKALAMILCGAFALSAGAADLPPKQPAAPLTLETRGLMDVLKADGRYKILVSALESTGLDTKLDAAGTVTFFAPTDKAFQRVPKLAELLRDNARLAAILRHHVLENRRLDTHMLRSEALLTPMEGKAIKITAQETSILLDDDAKIVHPNADLRNGLLHGIDHVLMENNDSMLREAGATVEEGVKDGAKKVYDGLKTGADKIKDALD